MVDENVRGLTYLPTKAVLPLYISFGSGAVEQQLSTHKVIHVLEYTLLIHTRTHK